MFPKDNLLSKNWHSLFHPLITLEDFLILTLAWDKCHSLWIIKHRLLMLYGSSVHWLKPLELIFHRLWRSEGSFPDRLEPHGGQEPCWYYSLLCSKQLGYNWCTKWLSKERNTFTSLHLVFPTEGKYLYIYLRVFSRSTEVTIPFSETKQEFG